MIQVYFFEVNQVEGTRMKKNLNVNVYRRTKVQNIMNIIIFLSHPSGEVITNSLIN